MYLKMINHRGLNDTEHMSGDGTEINDGKKAASQVTGQNSGSVKQGNEVQGNKVQGNEVQDNKAHKEKDVGSHNTHNTLLTVENSSASQRISFTDTATEKVSWCFVGQYTEGGKKKDGTYPRVEVQEVEKGRLQYRIHNPKNPNHEDPVQWGRFVLDEECYVAFATTKKRMVEHVRRKLHKPADKPLWSL